MAEDAPPLSPKPALPPRNKIRTQMEENSLLGSSSSPPNTIIPASTLPSDPTTSPLANSCSYDSNSMPPLANDNLTAQDSPGNDLVFYASVRKVPICWLLAS